MSLFCYTLGSGGPANMDVTIPFIPLLEFGGPANAGVTSMVHYVVLIIRLMLVLMHPYIPSRMDLLEIDGDNLYAIRGCRLE